MASFYLCPFASFLQLLTDAGQVQPGLLMWTYLAGTTTPQTTYTDITGGTPNSNPIQLNSAGRLPNVSVWQAGGVALKIQFSTNAGTVGSPVFGVQIGPTFDQVSGIDDPAVTLAQLASTASGSGADLVANAMRSYDLIASVRAANVPNLASGGTLVIDVEGGTAVNDGGGGFFYWSASSTATDDGLNVIKPTAISGGSPGRYLRQYNIYGTITNFNLTCTGFSGSTTPATLACTALLNGSFVIVSIPAVTGTSNAPTFNFTGWPSLLLVPGSGAIANSGLNPATDNGTATSCYLSVGNNIATTVGLAINTTSGAWTSSGTKAFAGGTFVYTL